MENKRIWKSETIYRNQQKTHKQYTTLRDPKTKKKQKNYINITNEKPM